MEVLYYHSKLNEDPLGLGKRMTVCCLIDNNKMLFGIAKINNKDTFVRAIGRNVAQGRAKMQPITIEEQPLGEDAKQTMSKTRKFFVETAKALVTKFIRSDKELQLFRDKPKKNPLVRREIENTTKKLFKSLVRSMNHTPKPKGGKVVEMQPTAFQLHPQ